jgi:adenylate kinase family enzyme
VRGRPKRVLVAGTSGAGKTTVACRIAEMLDVPHTEIDGLYHGPGWTKRADFRTDVEQLSQQPHWVTEWQYREVRDLLAARADTLIWLDLPRRVVMTRVVRRTFRRRIRQERLWNENIEPPLWTFFVNRDHIVRWAWNTHGKYEALVATALQDNPGLTVVRLRSQREIDQWLAELTDGPESGAPS